MASFGLFVIMHFRCYVVHKLYESNFRRKNLATIFTVHMNLMMVYDIIVTDIESIF